MAPFSAINKVVIILALLICLQILFAESRQLWEDIKQKQMKTNSNTLKTSEESQPTPPNQSPSLRDQFEAGTQVMQPPPVSPDVSSSFADSLAAYKDDFQPTTPGFSPGVGYPKVVAAAEIAGPRDDFRPTGPGHSPGVGHSQEVAATEIAGSTDDFRPTGPGHSPGAGHAFQKENVEPHA